MTQKSCHISEYNEKQAPRVMMSSLSGLTGVRLGFVPGKFREIWTFVKTTLQCNSVEDKSSAKGGGGGDEVDFHHNPKSPFTLVYIAHR